MKGVTLKPCPVCGSSLMIDEEDKQLVLVCLLGGHRFERPDDIRKLIIKNPPVIRRVKEEPMIAGPVALAGTKPQNPNTPEGVKSINAAHPPLPPIPPKPQGEQRVIRLKLSQYYKDNAAAILADVKLLGDAAARKRWGCSASFWIKFRSINNLPSPGRGRKKAGQKPPVKPFNPVDDVTYPKPRLTIDYTKPSVPEPAHRALAGNPPAAPQKFAAQSERARILEEELKQSATPLEVRGELKFPETAYPVFDSTWSDEVKKAWLNCFTDLKNIEALRYIKSLELTAGSAKSLAAAVNGLQSILAGKNPEG